MWFAAGVEAYGNPLLAAINPFFRLNLPRYSTEDAEGCIGLYMRSAAVLSLEMVDGLRVVLVWLSWSWKASLVALESVGSAWLVAVESGRSEVFEALGWLGASRRGQLLAVAQNGRKR